MGNNSTCAVANAGAQQGVETLKSTTDCIFKPNFVQNLVFVLLPAAASYKHKQNGKMVLFWLQNAE